jgi:hypothetical protein
VLLFQWPCCLFWIPGVLVASFMGYEWYLATFDEEQFKELMGRRHPRLSLSAYKRLRFHVRFWFPVVLVSLIVSLILLLITIFTDS